MSDQWHILVDAERVARVEAFDAQNTDRERDALRKWWKAVEDLLRKAVVPRPEMSPGPIPPLLLHALSGLAGHLAIGDVPGPIANVVGEGSISFVPTELHDIRIAVTYRCAAAAGMIDDKSPVKTIVEAYGLGDRTALQKWCRQHEPYDLGQYYGPGHDDSQVIRTRMLQSGARYKLAGRAHKAINGRGNK